MYQNCKVNIPDWQLWLTLHKLILETTLLNRIINITWMRGGWSVYEDDHQESCSIFGLQIHQLLNELIDSKRGLNLAWIPNTTLRVQAAYWKQKHLELRYGCCYWRSHGFLSFLFHPLSLVSVQHLQLPLAGVLQEALRIYCLDQHGLVHRHRLFS